MSTRRVLARLSPAAALLAAVGVLGGPPGAQAEPQSGPQSGPLPSAGPRAPAPDGPADLDVLYVGAHPDDEASRLSTFGEWRERYGARTGVVTVTRGEGGGNAVGPEEGPALGLIREREERSAVGRAGVSDVYNFDRADFYYSVSAPLHQEAWDQEETLGQLVRVIRETTPEIVMTMDPAPSPGNHGGHQDAALLAIEAYYAAGDPTRYPEQLRREGLEPFAPAKLFTTQVRGQIGSTGPACATTYTPTEPADDVYGVFSGRRSTKGETRGKTWAQIEREAQRRYASQGWSVFPDVSADPSQLSCDMMRQIDARVPFVRGDLSRRAASPRTMLEGAVLPQRGGLPLGTGLDLSLKQFDVVPGGRVTLTLELTAPDGRALPRATVRLDRPDGWKGPGRLRTPRLAAGESRTLSFDLRVPASAEPGRELVGATVKVGGRRGFTDQQVEVVPAVEGRQRLLPQVAEFTRWAERVGVEQLTGTVTPVRTLPSGGARAVDVDVTNHGRSTASGEIALELPAGFSASGPVAFSNLAPGRTTRVQVVVTNTDASLPTGNQGGTGGVAGDHAYRVRTTVGGVTSTTGAALELVPAVTVPDAAAPTLDGQIGESEYGTRIDLSRRWEGDACTSPTDCSATGWVTRAGDSLYVAVDVTDDVLGTVVAPADCKRHWRMDSVEVALDPTGTSENTSTAFKVAMLPTTTAGVACAFRDADNDQGPIGTFRQVGANGTPAVSPDSTAPGFAAVSRLKEPYTGYVVEMRIPFTALPETVDPEQLGLNAFVYDSDTQNLTGQTRLGWSTWGGVQGDPYRWGRVRLTGPTPPPVPTSQPRLDFPALQSVDSPQSIQQALRTGVALSGLGWAPERAGIEVVRFSRRGGDWVVVVDAGRRGRLHAFAIRGSSVLGDEEARVGKGRSTVRIEAPANAKRLLVGFDPAGRGTDVATARLR